MDIESEMHFYFESFFFFFIWFEIPERRKGKFFLLHIPIRSQIFYQLAREPTNAGRVSSTATLAIPGLGIPNTDSFKHYHCTEKLEEVKLWTGVTGVWDTWGDTQCHKVISCLDIAEIPINKMSRNGLYLPATPVNSL
jgi:hypothetical protein